MPVRRNERMSHPGADPVLPRLRCRHCGDVIGAYEPTVVQAPQGPRHTSVAAEPELHRTDEACFHRDCFTEAAGLDG
jgi:hypothetical protein